MEKTPISSISINTILVCFLMNILDGMDVMIISYAASSIGKEWACSPEALGVVFSAGLVGMAIGAMFLAPFADKIGRKNMILLFATIMGISTIATIWAIDVTSLAFFRVISGVGIGGMLASSSTLSSEYAPTHSKDFWVSFVMSGYPVGAVLSGLVAAKIIPIYGWRMMFQGAGYFILATLPLIYFFLAESLDFLLKKQPTQALQKINTILQRMDKPILVHLPDKSAQNLVKTSFSSLFAPTLKIPTLMLWTAIFMAFATLYFLTSWIPKLAVSTGLSPELAIYAGTIFNLGAFVGIITQGFLSEKYGLYRTIFSFFIATALLMFGFGFLGNSVFILTAFALIGFGIQGGFIGLYAAAARIYPTEIRSTGIGWTIGIGRVGAIISPLIGGFLIGKGFGMTENFIFFAIPALIAAFVSFKIKME
jgi:MFS transporter, AAHS family, 4-hydroxybenzoate transporter